MRRATDTLKTTGVLGLLAGLLLVLLTAAPVIAAAPAATNQCGTPAPFPGIDHPDNPNGWKADRWTREEERSIFRCQRNIAEDGNGDGEVAQYIHRALGRPDSGPGSYWTTIRTNQPVPQETRIIPAHEYGSAVTYEVYLYRICDADEGIHYRNLSAYPASSCRNVSHQTATHEAP